MIAMSIFPVSLSHSLSLNGLLLGYIWCFFFRKTELEAIQRVFIYYVRRKSNTQTHTLIKKAYGKSVVAAAVALFSKFAAHHAVRKDCTAIKRVCVCAGEK